MKIYRLLLCMTFLSCLFSCSKESIEIFDAKPEVYFEKFYINAVYPGVETADSTLVSFFFYPDDTKSVTASLVVNLSGEALTSDLHFGLRVVEEETTASPDEYELEDSYTFHVDAELLDTTRIQDIIKIKLNRSDRLKDMPDGVKLVVELVPNETVGLGQTERIRAKIILTTSTIQPDWWQKGGEVEKYLLGDYSVKKYWYFLNYIDREAQMSMELIEKHPDQAISLALKFKAWLAEQNPAIKEDNGEYMQVKI